MRIVATLQEADAGSVRLGDIDVLKDKHAVRKVLGYLPQEFGVYPRVNAYEMLDHIALLKGVTNKGERKELVEALLQRVNLWEHRKRRLETDMKSLASELSTLKASVAQQAVDVAALKKQGNPGAAVERLEQDLMVLKSELENRPAPAQGTNTAEFDVFRGQVTRNINTLQSQIQNLQKQISARP